MDIRPGLLLGGPNDGTVVRFGPLGQQIFMPEISEYAVAMVEELGPPVDRARRMHIYEKARTPPGIRTKYLVYFYRSPA